MKNWLRNKDNSEEQLAKNSNHITEQEACHSTHSISVDRTGVWDWSTVRKFKSKTNCGDFIATTSKKMVRDMQCQEIYPCRMYFQVHPGNKTKRGARLAAMPRKVTPKLVFRWSYFEPGVTFDPSVSLQLRICYDSVTAWKQQLRAHQLSRQKCQQLLGKEQRPQPIIMQTQAHRAPTYQILHAFLMLKKREKVE